MRIDHDRQRVYVVRRGRTYEAPLSEVETAARVPSARVQFRVRRSGGSEVAEQVRLRTGTRTSKRQRRFGDLTGARRPGSKVETTAHSTFGIDVTSQPFRVVRAWLAAISDRDFDGAISLYLPSAVVHTPDGTVSGRNHLRALVESYSCSSDPDEVELLGRDRYVWAVCEREGSEVEAFFAVADGLITEQWLGVEPPIEPEAEEAGLEVEVVTRGDISATDIDYGRDKLAHVRRLIDEPLRLARLKLSVAANPRIERPAMAEATLDIDGSLVRGHASAPTMTEAVDTVIRRLQSRLEHQRDRERHKPTGLAPVPGEWRRGNLSPAPLPYFDRPAAERELVRHKSFAAEELTLEEAAWDMAALDYDFFLFVELTTGADSLVEQGPGGDFVVHHLDRTTGSGDEALELPSNGWRRSELPVPTLVVSEAIEMLDQTGDRFVFFENAATGRANVVYRRYDGHYGLITPPPAPASDKE